MRQAAGAGINFLDTANRVSLMRKSAQVSAHDGTSGPGVDRRSRVSVAGYIPLRSRLVAERGTSGHDVRLACLAVASNRRQASITSLVRSRLMRREVNSSVVGSDVGSVCA
jgi:hypothetical protein